MTGEAKGYSQYVCRGGTVICLWNSDVRIAQACYIYDSRIVRRAYHAALVVRVKWKKNQKRPACNLSYDLRRSAALLSLGS